MLRQLTVAVGNNHIVVEGLVNDGLNWLSLQVVSFLLVAGSRPSNEEGVVELALLLVRRNNHRLV